MRSPFPSGSLARLFFRKGLFAAICGGFFLLVACDPPEVRIELAPDLAGAAIQVDFVRVPRERLDEWMSLDVDAYFSPGNRKRAAAVERGDVYSVFVNVPDRPFLNRIQSNDAVWSRHPFVRRRTDQSFDILIIADMPGVWAAREGTQEVRIRRIPLLRRSWSLPMRGLEQMTITVSSQGIRLSPAPRGEETPVGEVPPAAVAPLPDEEPDDEEPDEERAGDVFAPSQLDGPLRPISTPEPQYPASFLQRQLAGQVRAVILIDETGAVSVLEIAGATHPEAIPYIREALGRWRFQPPRKDRQPVRVRAVQPFNYDFR